MDGRERPPPSGPLPRGHAHQPDRSAWNGEDLALLPGSERGLV